MESLSLYNPMQLKDLGQMISSTQIRGSVRWVDYARRSMQRVGFVKWALSLSSQAQTLESLTRRFAASVTKIVDIPVEKQADFEKYVQEQHVSKQRYGDGFTSAQIQDLYLSDPTLPSHSGAITGDLERKGYRHAVYVEIPTWAVRLRLLRDHNYTVTDRGKVLLLARQDTSVESSSVSDENPLHLNIAERYVALFSLLDADGDLLKRMYQRLVAVKSFTRADAGDAGTEALEELRVHLKNASAGPLQQLRSKVDRTIMALRNQKPTGLGPKESLATPRTEPLVDCGILCRPSNEKYEYSFTDWGREFFLAFIADPSVDDFLQLRLSKAMSWKTGQEVKPELRELDIIRGPYNQLRSGLGYVSLRELSIAVIAQMLLGRGGELVEIDVIERSLKQAAGSGNRQVRLAVGRTGGSSTQVRIDQRASLDDNARN